MANVLIGATGSVAAMRVPELCNALAERGHAVKVVATEAALYFFDAMAIGKGNPSPNPLPETGRVLSPPSLGGKGAGGLGFCFREADQWPGDRYERGDPVIHIELRKWADILVVAPLDANTLAKLAVGLCDNCLTCIWRAWDVKRPVVLAPAMNTLMWENPFTRRHLRSLAADAGAGHIPGHLEGLPLIAQINDRSKTLRVVPPIEKELACGDVGIGALAEVVTIAAAVDEMLSRIPAAT